MNIYQLKILKQERPILFLSSLINHRPISHPRKNIAAKFHTQSEGEVRIYFVSLIYINSENRLFLCVFSSARSYERFIVP